MEQVCKTYAYQMDTLRASGAWMSLYTNSFLYCIKFDAFIKSNGLHMTAQQFKVVIHTNAIYIYAPRVRSRSSIYTLT